MTAMSDRQPAWNERDTTTVAHEGMTNPRENWRKVEVTSDPVSGNIVLTYKLPNGTSDIRHYTQQQFLSKSRDIAKMLMFHVLP